MTTTDRAISTKLNIHHPIQPAYLSRRVCGVRVRYACGISVRTTPQPLPRPGSPELQYSPVPPWFIYIEVILKQPPPSS